MKAYFMFRDRNLDLFLAPAWNSDTTLVDLEIPEIIKIMAGKNDFISEVCSRVFHQPLTNINDIQYRQEILRDVLKYPSLIQEYYSIVETTEIKINKYLFGLRSSNVRNTYYTSIDYIQQYLDGLKEFRKVIDRDMGKFQSTGLVNFQKMIQEELNDTYIQKASALISELSNNDGTLIRAKLGPSLYGESYTLCRIHTKFSSLRFIGTPTMKLKEEDEVGRNDFNRRVDRAMATAANALVQSAEHLEQFYHMLRTELAFYIGVIQLKNYLERNGMPYCIPDLVENQKVREWDSLYDMALVSKIGKAVIPSSLCTKNKDLFIITGANQGGKTTFLRGMGQAQVMAQCGMIVGANRFTANVKAHIYTHYKREEDKTMNSGKLDEELSRMNQIIDHLDGNSLLLFNESFASTNETEGSEIHKQIIDALIAHGNEVLAVTHLYTLSSAYIGMENVEFLKAERMMDGDRSHKIIKGMPEKTAYGEDLYQRVFID